MSAVTLSALVLAFALPAFGQLAPPSQRDVLTGVFQALLTPEQAAQLEQPPSAGRIVALFAPQQKEAAKQSLAARAAATKDPDELAELAKGYQLLGEPQGLIEIGALLATQYPKDSRGYSMAADGMLKRGKHEAASELAGQALALNPDDKRAQGIRVYLAALQESKAGNKPIEAAMVGLPKGAAYKAAASMAAQRPDSALAVSASKALSDLRPTASRHVPLNLAPEQEPALAGAPKTPRGAAMAAATAAAVTVGSVILFLGLLPKRLDQDYPWLKAGMTGGMLLLGAWASYDLMASRFLFGYYGASWSWGGRAAASNIAGQAGTAAAAQQAAPSAPAAGQQTGQVIGNLKDVPKFYKGSAGQTVLGSFPTYLTTAEKMKAKALDIPSEVWAKMSEAERWAINQRFLDKAIYRGDQFFLATDPLLADPKSWYFKELQYLFAHGYVLNDAGNKVIKAK